MFWGIIMEPNKRYTQEVEKSFHVSQAALDISTGDSEPVQIMISFSKRNYLIGTLQKGKLLQMPLDLNFQTGDMITFTSNGNCHVHLTGYLVPEDDDLDAMMGIGDVTDESETEEVPTLVQDIKREKRKASEISTPQKDKKIKIEQAEALKSESDDDDYDPEESIALSGDDSITNTATLDSDDDDSSDDLEDEDDEEESEEEIEEPQPVKESKKSKKHKKKATEVTSPQQNGQVEEHKSKKEKKQKQKDNNVPSTNNPKKHLSGGVVIEDIKLGDGANAKPGRAVSVYYEGRLKTTNKVFDSSLKGNGFKFILGRGEVIKGWDVGVEGMKVGGKRRILCPPSMAYGVKGSPPVIPSNSTLVFEVELKRMH